MLHNSLFGFSVQFLAALTWGDWKDTAQSVSLCSPLCVSLKQCSGLIRGWRGACSCVTGVGKAGRKSIAALKSESINVFSPGSQGCGTSGAVMASPPCTDGGARHSSAA